MESFIIDNLIVSKFMDNGISISPINLAKNPSLNIDGLQKITYGSKVKDHIILSQLSHGTLTYEAAIMLAAQS